MNITQQSEGPLNALITIKVEPNDYVKQVDAGIKKAQKNASMPGFRPGKVPAGMIRKMYGKSILADEMNKMLNDALYKYLEDNKINFLGNPMPKDNGKEAGNWETPGEFEFFYELGLAPEFEFNITGKEEFEYATVEVTDKMIEDTIADFRRRHGQFSNPEVAEEGDILYGEFTELNETNEPKENGISTTTTVALEFITDPDERKKFIGLKKDEVIEFNPGRAIQNAVELSAMLRITKEQAESLTSNFKFTVQSVNRIQKAEMNAEFFDKVYGAGNVVTEEDFRNKVKEQISTNFTPESDRLLRGKIVEHILTTLNLTLPDSFLKRWMQAANEKPVSMEQVEKEYEIHAKEIRWQLVMGKILKSNPDITITKEELDSYAKAYVRSQFSRYGMYNMEEDKVESYAKEMLKKEAEVRRFSNDLMDNKVFQLLKTSYTLKNVSMPYEEFVKLNKLEPSMES